MKKKKKNKNKVMKKAKEKARKKTTKEAIMEGAWSSVFPDFMGNIEMGTKPLTKEAYQMAVEAMCSFVDEHGNPIGRTITYNADPRTSQKKTN